MMHVLNCTCTCSSYNLISIYGPVDARIVYPSFTSCKVRYILLCQI